MPDQYNHWIEPTTVAGAVFIVGTMFFGLAKSIWNWVKPRATKAIDAHLSLVGTLQEQSKEQTIHAKDQTLLLQKATEIQESNSKLQRQQQEMMGQLMEHQKQLLSLMQEHHKYALENVPKLITHGDK